MPRHALPICTILLLLAITGPPLAQGEASSGTPPEGILAIDEAFVRGGESAVAGFLPLLKDRDLDVRTHASAALCTLEQIGDARAAWPIVRMLGDPQVGQVAVFLAARMGQVAVEPLLLSLRDENPAVRTRSAVALGEMRESRAEAPLRESLNDHDSDVREAASKALQRISQGTPSP